MSDDYKTSVVNGIILCDACLDGVGGECHTPGCFLFLNRAPDLPLRATLIASGCEIIPTGDLVEQSLERLSDEVLKPKE